MMKKKRIKKNTSKIEFWLENQKSSPYKYTLGEIFDAISDPVILHFYPNKLKDENKCNKFVIQWLKYAKLSGKYEILKLKYPQPFNSEKFIN